MSAPQFTPGPWYVKQAFGSDLFRIMHHERGQGWYRETRLDADKAGAFTRSDARLIAAAPDLYAALELAREMFVANDLYLEGTFEKIDAALAKARGEQVPA